MAEYVLTCCSTADMPAEWFAARSIPYLCFHFTLEGREYPDDLGKSISFEDFYARVAAGAMPTTSQINMGQFVEFFEGFLARGLDVLHVSFSGGLSGAANSARLAAAELREKYPARRLVLVDSLAASSGYGLLMELAADRRDAGMDLQTLAGWLEENKLKLNHWFFSTNLAHYRRGGRISAAAAAAGTLLHICPLLNVSSEGKLVIRKKVRGKQHVIAEIVQQMRDHAENRPDYAGKCFISHSACYADARRVADLVEAAFPKLAEPVRINSVGTVIGSHTGPGTVALFFVGDERTD